MNAKIFLLTFLVCFIALCGFLAIENLIAPAYSHPMKPIVTLASGTVSGTLPAEQQVSEDDSFDLSRLTVISAADESATIGSIYPETGFKFELELTSRGAAVVRATLSGFDDRDPDNPQPLVILSPVIGDKNIYSMKNGDFELVDQKQRLPLDRLNWRMGETIIREGNSEGVTFEAIIKDAGGKDIIKINKMFKIGTDSYNIDCEMRIENLCDRKLKSRFDIQGPVGIGREGARGDMRKLIAAFATQEGIESVKAENSKLRKAKKNNDEDALQLKHRKAGAHFIWAATTNKYFAAILRPVPQENEQWPQILNLGPAQYYDPGLADKKPDGDENSSFSLQTTAIELAAAGQVNSTKRFEFQLYLGPKDRDIFEKNELYKKLAYFQTIDFRGCCCPTSIISPLAFGIMGLMKWMYNFVPNYGVVIMILVFLVRILMHPVTKKSQVSMMKMQKLGPKIEEIKKKYANNKADMNKQVMALYKEQGVSPFTSMLPMMMQMPIWIALWTAIYTSIELRGAPFLPVWITDLSAPDALIRFKSITIPLLDWQIDSFNLLPILMGVVMYMQQKLMPHSSSAKTDPQTVQQQKMMMVMMTLLFPIMLYKGPSGVNLYILSSIGAGVIEQMVIRKHIREKEADEAKGLVAVTSKTGGKFKKKKPKPFFRY